MVNMVKANQEKLLNDWLQENHPEILERYERIGMGVDLEDFVDEFYPILYHSWLNKKVGMEYNYNGKFGF